MGLGSGTLVGFIVMIILGWIPIFGPLIAGFAAGLVAGGGAGRGATAGFLAGILGGIIIGTVITFLGVAFLGPIGALLGIFAGFIAIVLSLGGAIIALIG